MCLDYIVDLHITLRVQIFNDMPQNSKNGLGEELHMHTLLLQPHCSVIAKTGAGNHVFRAAVISAVEEAGMYSLNKV